MSVKPAPKGPIKAIGYIRAAEKDDFSPEAQRRQIRACAEMRGISLVSIVEDVPVAAHFDLGARDGGVRLAELLKAGKADAVIAARLDRLFGGAADCSFNVTRWMANGIGLHLVDLGLDTNSPTGRAFAALASAFADLERATLPERVRELAVRAEGGKQGVAPYGWRHGDRYVGQRRELLPVPEEQAVIERILSMRAKGSPFEAIADVLNDEKVPTKRQGTKWRMSTIRAIVLRVQAERGNAAP